MFDVEDVRGEEEEKLWMPCSVMAFPYGSRMQGTQYKVGEYGHICDGA